MILYFSIFCKVEEVLLVHPIKDLIDIRLTYNAYYFVVDVDCAV